MQGPRLLAVGCVQPRAPLPHHRPSQSHQQRLLAVSSCNLTCILPAARRHPGAAGRRQGSTDVTGSGGLAAVVPLGRQQAATHVARASSGSGSGGPGNNWGDRQQRKVDQQIVVGVGIGLTVLVFLTLRLGGDSFQDADAWNLGEGDATFGAGDALGALLWAASLYYCSPLQLLLLFFGFIETERPSDWVLRRLGLAAGLDVDALDYRVPAALQAATVALFGTSGFALAWCFQALLGDATWSVSTGLGSCMAAAMYEVGRPRRLSVEEAQALESKWQDFAKFADQYLQRSGRCHETEIQKALQRELPRYRGERAIDSATIRDLVRNWAPDAERTSNGYYRGISLQGSGPAAGGSSSSVGAGSRLGSSAEAGIGSSSSDSTDQY